MFQDHKLNLIKQNKSTEITREQVLFWLKRKKFVEKELKVSENLQALKHRKSAIYS